MPASIAALMIHQVAKRALGIAASGEAYLIARTAPRPAFCMPTPIARVRRCLLSNLNSAPAPYPKTSPERFRSTTAIKTIPVICPSEPRFSATTKPQIDAINIVEKAGNTGRIFSMC